MSTRQRIRSAVLALVTLAALVLTHGAAQGLVLSGTADGWEGGEARVVAESFIGQDGSSAAGHLAEGTIHADGRFEVALPDVVPPDQLAEIDALLICEVGGLTLSPESFQGAGIFGLMVYRDDAPIGMLAHTSSRAVAEEHEGSATDGDFAVFYVYSQEPASISGSCVREEETEHIELDLEPGWTTLLSTNTVVEDGAARVFETTIDDVPEGAGWYFVAFPDDADVAPGAAFTVTETSLEGPEALQAGYNTIMLHNAGDRGSDLMIVRLAGGTEEDLAAGFAAVDAAYASEAGEGDAVTLMREVLARHTYFGGVSAAPGEAASFGVELPAGRYVVLGNLYGEGDEEQGPGANTYVTTTIEVVGAGAAAPAADVTVQLVDFAFAFPPGLEAGEQTWEFVNRGEQVHVAAIMRLLPGKTMDDVMTFIETFDGEDPAEEFASVGMISTGVSNFLTMDLEPGTYLAVCWVPDYAEGGDGAPHYEHGMLQSFTIPGD